MAIAAHFGEIGRIENGYRRYRPKEWVRCLVLVRSKQRKMSSQNTFLTSRHRIAITCWSNNSNGRVGYFLTGATNLGWRVKLPELTKAEAKTSRSGSKIFAFESLNRKLHTTCHNVGGLTGIREKLSAVSSPVSSGEDGRAIADVELVFKASGLYQDATDDEHRRFDEILAEDEELAAMYDEYYCMPRWLGWIAGVRAVFNRWQGR
jgi:hypothetical protein